MSAPVPIWFVVAGAGMRPDPRAIAGIPPTFDAIFERVGIVPAQLLKANAWHESAFDPKAVPTDRAGKLLSSAKGFGQIIDSSRDFFNRSNGYNFSAADMFDPEKNTMVAAWLLQWSAKRIQQLTGWPVDWNNPLFVAAVLLSYAVGSTTIPNVIETMHKGGVPFSQMTTARILEYAGKLHPASTIEVDPKRADPEGRGPMASSPAVPKALAAKLRDYLALRAGLVAGAPPPAVATVTNAAVFGPPAPSAAPAPPADYRPYKQPTKGGPGGALAVLGIVGALAVGHAIASREGWI